MRAIVTGAARGLGLAIAQRLAADGGAVAFVDVQSQVVAQAAAAGGTAVGLVADVGDEAAVERLVADAVGALGGLDLLVNCAGIGGPSTALVDTSADAFRRVLDVNLTGTFLMARAAGRAMVAQGGGGAIVNIGSLFGQQGAPWGGAYSASKGGIALLTQVLARELAGDDIRVNTIAPGNMDTEMHGDELRERARRAGDTFDDQLAGELREIPLGRLGTGDDVAGAVVWLAGPDAAYVTGQTIAVNGGVLLS